MQLLPGVNTLTVHLFYIKHFQNNAAKFCVNIRLRTRRIIWITGYLYLNASTAEASSRLPCSLQRSSEVEGLVN